MESEQFLSLLWPRALLRFETLELRAKKGEEIRRRFCTSISEFLKCAKMWDAEGWNIYFGISTRFGESGGKKSDCYRCRVVWVDLDSDQLPDFGEMPPDLIVKSGGGYHIYWVLEDPIFLRTGRWQEIEAINRALVKKYSGDIGAIDVSRVLRVPGFTNYKYDPPRKVEVVKVPE